MSFLVDSNVLIAAHRQYYAFPICPGFWQSIIEQYHGGKVLSIDRVKEELSNQGDALEEWIDAELPKTFFGSSDQDSVIEKYAELQQWANDETQYNEAAKAEFASVADAWVIAYAAAFDHTVVTLETIRDPNVKKRVPIPNVCEEFEISCINTFEMLGHLQVSFELSDSN